MSLSAATPSRLPSAQDRWPSEYHSFATTSDLHLAAGHLAPLSQDNLAQNVQYGVNRGKSYLMPIAHVADDMIPSWIFNSSAAGSLDVQKSLHSDHTMTQLNNLNRQNQMQHLSNGMSMYDSHTQVLHQAPQMHHHPTISSYHDAQDALAVPSAVPLAIPTIASSPVFCSKPDSHLSSGTSAKTTSSPDSTVPTSSVLPDPSALQDSVDSWMASNGFATRTQRGSHPDAAAPSQRAESCTDEMPFKTSADRRERNKASQRESRKRKQTRLETLEDENAALRKALSAAKQSKNTAVDAISVDSEPVTKFTGAIHLDGIESQLEDDSVEGEWRKIAGHLFYGRKCASGGRDDAEYQNEDSTVEEDSKPRSGRDKVSGNAATWEVSLQRLRQSKTHRIPSMVVVPELMLYKVCRLYFSIVLPFTTRHKSGIVNLRAARAAPGYLDGGDDLPRFRGPSSADPSAEFFLPKNLMPTEAQLRLGFHPVEIAVVPHPSMRDKLLTVLSTFQSIERFAKDGELDDQISINAPARYDAQSIRKRLALLADTSRWSPKETDDGVDGVIVKPDKSRVYTYGFLDKPKGSHRLNLPAQQWLNNFFVDLVQNLRVWSPGGDLFDLECFEYREAFVRKYPFMMDEQIMRSTNRWRRARGESILRL